MKRAADPSALPPPPKGTAGKQAKVLVHTLCKLVRAKTREYAGWVSMPCHVGSLSMPCHAGSLSMPGYTGWVNMAGYTGWVNMAGYTGWVSRPGCTGWVDVPGTPRNPCTCRTRLCDCQCASLHASARVHVDAHIGWLVWLCMADECCGDDLACDTSDTKQSRTASAAPRWSGHPLISHPAPF